MNGECPCAFRSPFNVMTNIESDFDAHDLMSHARLCYEMVTMAGDVSEVLTCKPVQHQPCK